MVVIVAQKTAWPSRILTGGPFFILRRKDTKDMKQRTTTEMEDQEILRLYLGSTDLIQREIARRYNLTQGTISQHVMTAAIKCMEMYNIRGSDTEIMRRNKIAFLGGDPDFILRVYHYVCRRSADTLSGAESRELRFKKFNAA